LSHKRNGTGLDSGSSVSPFLFFWLSNVQKFISGSDLCPPPAEVILFLLEPGECWRGFVQDKVHKPLMGGSIQWGSRGMAQTKEGSMLFFCTTCEQGVYSPSSPRWGLALYFSFAFTFKQRVQCVPRGCPQKLPWTTQRVQSIRKPHTLVCVAFLNLF